MRLLAAVFLSAARATAAFERQFAGEDAGRRNAFRAFFVGPAIERAYQEAGRAFAEEGSVSPK